MPSLLLVVFFLQLLIHLINTIGAPAINDLVKTPSPMIRPPLTSLFLNRVFYLAMVPLQQAPIFHRCLCARANSSPARSGSAETRNE